MASYSPKLLEKKYNNWVKAQLAVLFTKEGIEPFVCNEVQQFQLRCLNDICYNNGLNIGTICSNCCTENLVKCPTDRICNVGRGRCKYHRNAATKYLPSGCPNKICDHFKTEIQNVHRYYGPSYKNTDATKWCSNPWEVAKCFMPPDGYKDVTCSADTDFNGVISVIINDKDFQPRLQENLSSKNNIFEQARDIGRTVRHSPSLEVEDTDLQQYFQDLQKLLSDPVYLATDTCAQNSKQKLTDLENDTLVIGKDDIRKALDDVAKAAQGKIRSEIDEQKKQSEKNRLDLIKAKQEHLQELETKISEGKKQIEEKCDKSAKQIEDKGKVQIKQIEEKGEESVKQIEDKGKVQIKQIEEKGEESVKQIEDKGKVQIKQIEEKGGESVKQIEDKGKVQIKQIEEKGGESVKQIEDKGKVQIKQIEEKGEESVKQIEDKGKVQIKQIEEKGDKRVKQIEDKGKVQIKQIEEKGDKRVKQIEDKGKVQIKQIEEIGDKSVKQIEDKGKVQIKQIEEKGGESVKQIEDKGKVQIKQIEEKGDKSVKQIEDKGKVQIKQIEEKGEESVKQIEDKGKVQIKQIEEKGDKRVKQIEDKGKVQIKQIEEKGDKRVKQIEDKGKVQIKQIEEIGDKRVKQIEDKGKVQIKQIEEIGDKRVKQIEDKGESQVKRIDERTALGIKHLNDITDKKTETIKEELTNFMETLEETRYNESREKQYIDDKKRLKDQLIIWYRKNHSTVPLSPLTEGRSTPLANFYVKPDIDMHISYFSEKKETSRLKTLNDLFGSGRNVPQEIYLSADAGFGKTAFSKYLTMLWCQRHLKDENYDCFKEEEISALSGFDFVFLVPLRDSSNVCHVDEIIQTQLIENLQCSESLPTNFVSEILNDEKCLVILDGLDEWSHPKNICTRPIKCIPHRYARQENCVILTTTRPWKLGNSDIKTSQIDKLVELVELNNQSVQKLEMNALREMKKGLPLEELESQQQQLNKAIEGHDLKDLKSVPLILMYTIALWCDEIPIKESKSKLYASIIELLLSRTLKKYSDLDTAPDPSQCKLPQCFSDHDKCKKYSTLIIALGELAFHTLFSEKKENSLVFNRSVAEHYLRPGQLKLCLLSGILTENTVMKFSEDISRISFSHKTVQEYFTAVYSSCQPKRKAVKTITEKCQSLQDILDLKIFLLFISGMNPGIISSISHDLMSVINNDEITCKYRTMSKYVCMYINPLQDIQTMLISFMKECQQNKDVELCLQDVFITGKCQQGNYLKKIQKLCHYNKHNVKSIFIWNEGICSLKEIITSFPLCDLQNIEKLYYRGEIVEEEMGNLLLKPLKCLTVMSCEWENNKFVRKYCPLSKVIIEQVVKLQNLECLNIDCFKMSHQAMKTLLNFLTSKTSRKPLFNVFTSKTSMKEIILYDLYCSDHNTSCEGFNIDLSQHSDLRRLGLSDIPVSQLNINVSSLEECDVGELYKSGAVSSYISQLPAANKLQTLWCCSLKSSSDMETMLQTIPLLVHVKYIMLYFINLGERALTLSPEMVNIECVTLHTVTMSCSVLHDVMNVVNKLPHSVTIMLLGCDIKPKTEFEQFKTFIKNSDKCMVIFDGMSKYGGYTFLFKTVIN